MTGLLKGRDGARWQEEGEEPDYRFTLANERTFLAWIRTALAMLAAAVAVAQLVPSFRPVAARHILAGLLAALGLLISATAYWRWRGNQHAMRTGRPLPALRLAPVLTIVLTAVAVVVVVTVFLR